MSSLTSNADSAEEVLCRIHQVLDDADSETLADAEKRAQERHEQRLARIVADQWMYVARERLTLAWCAQMVYYWRKICSQSRRTKRQSFLASEHYTGKRFLRAFNALREGGQVRRRNQSTAADFHKKALGKRTFRGLSAANLEYKEHSRRRSLAKAFRVLKRERENQRVEKDMYDGAQKFYGTSLKKQALNGFSSHRKYLNHKLAREASASNHWIKSMGVKMLRIWSSIARRLATERRHGEKSRALRLELLLKRCITRWHSLAKQMSEERGDKIAQASQLWNRLSNLRQGHVWKAWVQLQKEKNIRHLKEAQAAKLYRGLRSAAATSAWRTYVREKERDRGRSSDAQSYWRRQALRSAIAIWQAYKADKKRGQAAALKALAHLRRVLTQKSINAWRPWHESHTSKGRDLQKAALIYKIRLQRWGCERILAVGLMLQALRLQSRLERQPKLSVSTFLRVAPYARKWWFLSQKQRKPGKGGNEHTEESSSKASNRVEVPLLLNKEPITHEVLLRIGLFNDSLRVEPQRSLSTPLETSGRPQPRGRMLFPSPTKGQPLGLSRPGARVRPPPRRPAFLSQISSTGSTSITAPSIPTSGQ